MDGAAMATPYRVGGATFGFFGIIWQKAGGEKAIAKQLNTYNYHLQLHAAFLAQRFLFCRAPSEILRALFAVNGSCRVGHPPDSPPPSAALRRQIESLIDARGGKLSYPQKSAFWRGLPWRMGGGGLLPDLGVVELIGEHGVRTDRNIRGGLFFQPANYDYTWHRHAAEEFYTPISGAAEWSAAGRAPLTMTPRNRQLIHHAPWQEHATRTGDEPLLAYWLWRGDLDFATYQLCPNFKNQINPT